MIHSIVILGFNFCGMGFSYGGRSRDRPWFLPAIAVLLLHPLFVEL